MNDSNTRPTDWVATSKRNTVRLGYWTLAWVATMAVAAFGPKFIWDFATLPTILALLVNLGVGFRMIVANNHYLQGLDELHKKIFLDASAFTLGVGLVCGLSYELLEDIKLISFEPEISHLVMLMCLTFLAGLIFGHRKYQ
ncbi:MAG: hypothetical protein RLN82_00550 [Pseudomonadales bacterium]